MSLLIRGGHQVVSPTGSTARRGEALGHPYVAYDAVIRCEGELIAFIGDSENHDLLFPLAEQILDVDGSCIVPGFVDPHTHPVFAGSREDEFNRRLRGSSYMDIAAEGGGINSTVRATRAATSEELLSGTLARLDTFLRHGTTTIEAKSGYGLDLETEIRMLEVIREANLAHPVDLLPTCLAAHEVPPEHREDPDVFIRLLIDEIHPEIATLRLRTAPLAGLRLTLDGEELDAPHDEPSVVGMFRRIGAVDGQPTPDGHTHRWLSWSDGDHQLQPAMATANSKTAAMAGRLCSCLSF